MRKAYKKVKEKLKKFGAWVKREYRKIVPKKCKGFECYKEILPDRISEKLEYKKFRKSRPMFDTIIENNKQ